jgi:hypothetical protein
MKRGRDGRVGRDLAVKMDARVARDIGEALSFTASRGDQNMINFGET